MVSTWPGACSRNLEIRMGFLLPGSFPCGSDGKESACNAGDPGLIPGSGRIPWKREWLLSPVFLPGDFHGQRRLVGGVHGVAELDMN